MTEVNFNTAPDSIIPQSPIIWTRAAWADAWTVRADLKVLEAQWTLAPEVATATLYYEFGSVLVTGASATATLTPITARGYFVLIKYPSDDGTSAVFWLGYAESPITAEYHPARDSLPEAGTQTIPCFGFLQALKFATITTTVHVDPNDDAELVRSNGGFVFNAGSKGNRSADKLTITEGDDDDESLAAYAFVNPSEKDPDWWSTRDIAEHLIAFHLPTPTGLTHGAGIPFSISNLTQLPDWDRPTLATDGRNIADILIELFSEDRLLQFGIGAVADTSDPPVISSVNIQPDTTVESALSLTGVSDMPVNSNLYTFVGDTDPMTLIELTEDDSEVVDQVIVQGPREIGVATFKHDSDSGEFSNDWVTADQNAYEAGASGFTDWSTKKQFEQRELNDQVRDKPQLRKVYRSFRIKNDWDGNASTKPVFVPPEVTDPVTPPYVPYLYNCRVLDRLPLFADVDYTGDATAVDESDGQTEIDNIVTIEDPDTNLQVEIDRLREIKGGVQPRNADAVNFGITADPHNEFGPGILLVVTGAPNHAIAGTGYVGNVADVNQDRVFGGYDYRTVRMTLALENDRRPYWKLPGDGTVAGLDVVRRKLIDLTVPGAELVYIAENTVVGFDEDGTELTSVGGVLRDPTDLIKSMTQLYARHFLESRKRLVIRTGRRPTSVAIGGLITSVNGYGTANCVIRSIRLSTPLDTGSARPEMTITAATSLFDPMVLIGQPRNTPTGPNTIGAKRQRRQARVNARTQRNIVRLTARNQSSLAEIMRWSEAENE